MMPIIFFIIALCFGVRVGTAFKAGMLVGIGFVGVGLVINLLLSNLGTCIAINGRENGVKPNGC